MILSEYEIDLIDKINSMRPVREASLYFESRISPLGVADQKALFIFLDRIGELVTLPDSEAIKSICSRINNKPNRLGLANPEVYKDCIKVQAPLIGYRAWSWAIEYMQNDKLYSMYSHTETPRQVTTTHRRIAWDKGSNQAACKTPWQDQIRDILPHQTHDCGFNVFDNFEKANSFLLKQHTWDRDKNKALALGNRFVLGVCAGAGNVQIHADGWRSEKAVILALLKPTVCSIETFEKAKLCSEFYNVPLFYYPSDLEDFANSLKEKYEL